MYLPLVETYKETKLLDEAGWAELYSEMLAAEGQAQRSSGSGGGSRSGQGGQNYLNSDLVKESVRSSIYWALFEVADILGRTGDAWAHLDRAHAIEYKARGRPLDLSATQAQTDQIKVRVLCPCRTHV